MNKVTLNPLSSNPTVTAAPPLALPGQEGTRIPERIGPFKILGLLSTGMALVYKAEQSQPQRLIALKIPRGGKLLSSESRERFLREVRHASSLDHAGIVPVLDAGEIDGTPYYTMPFIEGHSLDRYVEDEKPTLADRLQLFFRLCSVVQALHEKDLIHRDLKPANVLVDRYGDVRLLDFGLARALEEETTISMDQSLMGTLQYMAPEQTLPGGQVSVTRATDVYSLGVILYWLLTDTQPYNVKGPRESVLATIRESAIPAPSTKSADASVCFDPVVMCALAKNPGKRFRTAGELADAVRAAASGVMMEAPAPSPRRNRRTMDFILLGLLLGALIFVVGLLVMEFQRPSFSPMKRSLPNLPDPLHRR